MLRREPEIRISDEPLIEVGVACLGNKSFALFAAYALFATDLPAKTSSRKNTRSNGACAWMHL